MLYAPDDDRKSVKCCLSQFQHVYHYQIGYAGLAVTFSQSGIGMELFPYVKMHHHHHVRLLTVVKMQLVYVKRLK